jgi:uncharacterized protein YbjT (DUF2867 family)
LEAKWLCAAQATPKPVAEMTDAEKRAEIGDRISGRISREELASVVVAALGAPAAAGTTLELRRQEAMDAAGKKMGEMDNLR